MRPKLYGFLALIGIALFFAAVGWLINPPVPVGEALLKTYSEKYILRGQKAVDKDVGTFSGTERAGSLFIYFLQDRADPAKGLLSVSQDNGYSVESIRISGPALERPIAVAGDGKFWGNTISSKLKVPEKAYETQLTLASPDKNALYVEVTYWWIWRGEGTGAGEFMNRSATTNVTFDPNVP